jgi:hypothetical protein
MKKVLLSGLIAAIVMFVAGMAIGILSCKILPSMNTEYANSGIFRPMSDPLMSLFYVATLIIPFVFAWIWNKTKTLFHGNIWKNALYFTLVYFFISTLPGMIMTYSCFKISLAMTLVWTVTGVFQAYCASLVICGMNK